MIIFDLQIIFKRLIIAVFILENENAFSKEVKILFIFTQKGLNMIVVMSKKILKVRNYENRFSRRKILLGI